MILVIGSRSRTGRELVRRLRNAGVPQRRLTRSAAHAEGPGDVVGDLADPAALDAAMASVTKVFLLSTPGPDDAAQHANAVAAAARAGVTQLVRASILGADPDSRARFLRQHGEADARLRASGVPFTILRPNFFMHNVTTGWPAALDRWGNYRAPGSTARVSMVDARDVGAAAFAALTAPGHLGREYDLTGPEALSYADACERLGARLGRTVRYVPVDDASARSALVGAGLSSWTACALVELCGNYRRSGPDGYAARTTTAVQDLTGVPPRTLDRALAEDIPLRD